jgi:hypothetical protein
MSKLSLVSLQKSEIRKREQLKIRAGEDSCTCICPADQAPLGYSELKAKKEKGTQTQPA